MKSRTVFLLLLTCICVFSTAVRAYAQSDEDETTVDYLKPPSVGAPSVIRVYFQDAEGLEALRAEFDVRQHGNHDIRDPYVLVEVTPDEYKQLLGRDYEIQLDLAQTAFFNQPIPYDARQLSGIPGYECYRTVVETYASLDSLNATYPDLVELDDVGDSWLKVQNASSGDDIRSIVLTNELISGNKPKFLMIAAVHAREYTTAEFAMRFVEYLLSNYGVDPDVTWMLDHYELHVIPQGNPDGRKIAESADTNHRKNANTNWCATGDDEGVDLNRNNSFKWSNPGSSPSQGVQCSQTFQGTSPLSEPEDQAIADYVHATFPDLRGPADTDPAPDDLEGIFVTVHSAGEWVLPTWAWTTATTSPNATEIYTLGRKMGYYNHYEVCGTGQCFGADAGTHDDYVYGEVGVPSYTLELGTTFHQSCTTFENTIYPDNLQAMLYTFKATRRPYQMPSGPEVTTINVAAHDGSAVTGAKHITLTNTLAVTLTATVDDTRYDSNGWGSEPMQAIAEARYSIDAPSWVTGTISTTLTAADGTFNNTVENVEVVISTASWTPGRYTIFVEGKDADGNWGVPSAYFVTISAVPTATTYIYLPMVVDGRVHAFDLPISAEILSILISTTLLGGVTIVSTRRRN